VASLRYQSLFPRTPGLFPPAKSGETGSLPSPGSPDLLRVSFLNSPIPRRRFLQDVFGLGALASMGVLDPEKLLWVAGEKTVILAPSTAPKSNQFITVDMITRMWLEAMHQKMFDARGRV